MSRSPNSPPSPTELDETPPDRGHPPAPPEALVLVFAFTPAVIVVLAVAFVLAGVGIGCAETAQTAAVAALAPETIRGSAFGLLATVQAAGNVAASAVAGLLYTFASPTAAFCYGAAWMVLALIGLVVAGLRRTTPTTRTS